MKKEYPLALVIGRFQPLCNHHVEMVKEVWNKFKCKKLLIGIGDSGILSKKNFLKSEEVKELLELSLKNMGIVYELKIIPDINDPPNYGKHVESYFTEINETNCRLFTENDYTKDCFVNYGHKYKVICPSILPHKATEIREQILNSDKNWRKNVPKAVVEYMVKNKLINRLKSINS